MELSTDEAAKILGRGCAAGTVWGAVIGVLFLAVIALADGSVGEMAWAVIAAPIGAFIGGIVGWVAGLVLSVGEQDGPRSDCHRRVSAFVTSTGVVLLAAFWLVGAPLSLGGAEVAGLIALVGATAGALLAPYGARGRSTQGVMARVGRCVLQRLEALPGLVLSATSLIRPSGWRANLGLVLAVWYGCGCAVLAPWIVRCSPRRARSVHE